MKKLLVFVLASGLLAACNNSGDAAADVKDSLDSVTKEKTESIDEAAQQAKDTIKEANDSLKERVDSVADQTKDSLKK